MSRRDRSRWLVGGAWTACALALCLLVATTALDVARHHQLDRSQQDQAHQRSLAALSIQERLELGTDLSLANSQQEVEHEQLLADEDGLTSADGLTAGFGQGIVDQSYDIGTLDDCLHGVSSAVGSIARGRRGAAIDAIAGSANACLALNGGGGGPSGNGPVFAYDFPDPFVLAVGSTYYAYGTNAAAGNIQVVRSTDLLHWTVVGDALPDVPHWAVAGATWAPAVARYGSEFVLYYTVKDAANGQECISSGSSQDAAGPFDDASTGPLECQSDLGGSIDPDPVTDQSGQAYLVWKSEQGPSGGPPALWAQALDPAGTGLAAGGPSKLLEASQPWEGGVVEGPSMVQIGGNFYLFYSANDWSSAKYAIGYVRCLSVTGPCGSAAASPLLATGNGLAGPGGPSVFTDAHGTTWMAFHAYLPGAVGYPHSRLLFLRRLTFTPGGVTVGPGPAEQGSPSG